VQLIGICQSS